MIAIVFILVGGGALAAFVIAVMAIATRERDRSEGSIPAPQRDTIAASLLFHVVASAGASDEDALRQVRRGAGLAAPVTRGIDVANWAESYARMTTPQQRRELLEVAVQLVATRSPVPVRQYAALLDLSFGLGFQTDALAKLRELYGFEYVDHAKDGRPRGADREPLFARQPRVRAELLRVLGMDDTPTRQELSAVYRRLVLQHHPDRFHGATSDAQNEASSRFIEITRAYEELLRTLP
ncbi:MAG: J domain-containing protein [Thermoanaerobaculia bacterium]